LSDRKRGSGLPASAATSARCDARTP
jgi:hypothetical protein